MEALNRLADNSDNWQPRKTRYEPCLSVPPTRITRPLLASPNRVFNSERTNERAPPLRASKAFFAPPETCRSRPPVNDGAIVDGGKKGKKKRKKKRKKVFRTVSKKDFETSFYLSQTRRVFRCCMPDRGG